MMKAAVSDPVASRTLPTVSDALLDWDRATVPPAAAQQALASDIRNISDDELFGDLVRRLNSAKSGFRTLMTRTRNAVTQDQTVTDLVSVDKRWGDPAFWIAVQDAASTSLTDRNLLSAIDLQRDDNGSIVNVSEDKSANRTTLLRTLIMAGVVTLCCIVIGLPFAMVAASTNGWRRQLLLGAILLPLWTSLLVRTAAWYIILQDNGLINMALQTLGLTSGPVPLIFNRLGVVIAMTHVLLPFMVLPIFSVLIGIPKNLMPAAASLGASPIRAFVLVLLPLSLRGVVSGGLLVFMTALGYYITPALIGGAKDQMISSVIAYYATGAANWGMAGALGIVLLAATMILYVVYLRLSSEEARP
ncbi:ABC transporter permease [Brucella cytisi]|uniref:ABC transporter permease n=2 Tax=Brucella cytisi TaxID=407152 RepID=A0A1J6HL53_9HYPH|nr:ABC transporter permease [Brucella cytisi]